MSIRVSVKLDLCAGADNSLDAKIFGGNSMLSQLLDTLENGQSGTYQLDGDETAALDFGDVTNARMIFIEGDGEFSVAFAAAAASAALVTGVGGVYPTAFIGGEVLELEINGIAVTVTFEVGDQTRDQVIARINFAAALANAAFTTALIAEPTGAQLRLRSITTGPSSEINILDTTDADVLTALGLSTGITNGDAAEPGTTDVQVLRPADPDGASAAEGVQAFLFGTIHATAIQVTNLQSDAALNLKVFIAGDLVADT